MRVIKQVQFIGSFPRKPPETDLPEIAFVGRSNVGKSSAINTLLNRKKAARVSGTPGRTQAINIFEIDKDLRFVDLPGYGFAKVPKNMRNSWKTMISRYLFGRSALKLVVVLVDARHSAQDLDLQMLKFLQQAEISYLILATKTDCLKKSKKKSMLEKLRVGLAATKKDFVPFSSQSREGLDVAWSKIAKACGE